MVDPHKPLWLTRLESWGQKTVNIFFGLLAVVLLWIVFVVSVGLLVAVVAPSPDDTPFSDLAGFASVMTFGVAGGAAWGIRWAKNVPENRVKVRGVYNASISPIVRDFRIRSGMYRVMAAGLLAFLAFVTVVGFFVVSNPARERADHYEAQPGRLEPLIRPFLETDADRQMLRDPDVVSLLSAILQHGSYPTWSDAIGSVLLLVLLVQVIASLFRYMIRLASFYDSRADCLQMSGKVDELTSTELLSVIDSSSVSHDGRTREILRYLVKTPADERNQGV